MRLVIFSWRRSSAVEAAEHLNSCEGFHDTRAASTLPELRATLADGRFDALMIGHFAVPQFMVMQPALEHEHLLGLPRVVAVRGRPASVASDADRIGLDAVVDLGLQTTAENFLPVITEICERGRVGAAARQLSKAETEWVRQRFSVLYADRIDYGIGSFVAGGVDDDAIATSMRLAPNVVSDRVAAIIDRSRLLDRRELGAYHAGALVLDGSVESPVGVLPSNR